MSLLCRKRVPWLGLGVVLAGGGAFAADTYFVPELTVGGERHTNVDLNPTPTPDSKGIIGYSGNASAIFGARTQRSVTEVRPRVQYYDYPKRDELKRTNEFLDIKSGIETLRSDFEIVGSYRKQTTYEAQLLNPEFDDFDPNDPNVDTPSRRSLISEDRTRIQVRPTYSHKFTERLGTDLYVGYETMRFDSEGESTSVDYDYLWGGGLLTWDFGPKTKVGAGMYGAEYKGEDADQVHSSGLEMGIEHKWSPILFGTAKINVERTEIESITDGEGSTNDWGLQLGMVRNGQISQLRFDVERSFSPSSVGSRTVLDQIRLQYSHRFTPRWFFVGAVRGYRSRLQGRNANDGEDRDYASAYVQMGWNVTRTWSVSGGYSYYWRKFAIQGDDANDQIVSLGITYKGLRPQR